MSNVAELDTGPVSLHFVEEGLQIEDSFVLVVQSALNPPDLFRVLRVLPLLRLQFDDLSGPKVRENAVISNGLHDFVEAALESTHPTDSNVVLGCTAFVLILGGGVLA